MDHWKYLLAGIVASLFWAGIWGLVRLIGALSPRTAEFLSQPIGRPLVHAVVRRLRGRRGRAAP